MGSLHSHYYCLSRGPQLISLSFLPRAGITNPKVQTSPILVSPYRPAGTRHQGVLQLPPAGANAPRTGSPAGCMWH